VADEEVEEAVADEEVEEAEEDEGAASAPFLTGNPAAKSAPMPPTGFVVSTGDAPPGRGSTNAPAGGLRPPPVRRTW
jgi:hypothetical protein